MEKLRQGSVLHLGVKGVDDDEYEGKIIFPVTSLSRQIAVPAQPPGEGMSRSTYAKVKLLGHEYHQSPHSDF
jgi:hypothetical protein